MNKLNNFTFYGNLLRDPILKTIICYKKETQLTFLNYVKKFQRIKVSEIVSSRTYDSHPLMVISFIASEFEILKKNKGLNNEIPWKLDYKSIERRDNEEQILFRVI